VPPAPGIIPSRVSGSPTTALELRTRKWVERASSRPPPRAMEEIAEIVGIGRAESEVRVVRRLRRKAAVLCCGGGGMLAFMGQRCNVHR